MNLHTSPWVFTAPPRAIRLVRRPKLLNPRAWHFGVAVDSFFGPTTVYDLTDDQGFRQRSVAEFLQGRPLDVLLTRDGPADIRAAWNRLQSVQSSPHCHEFNILGRNCEQVARYIVTGERRSLQLQTVAFFSSLALLLVVLHRAA